MKKNNLKKYWKILKENWKIPRFRAIIKLSLYAIMFLMIIILVRIGNDTANMDKKTENKVSYNDIIKNTKELKYKLSYKLSNNSNICTIDGDIEDNILTGYITCNNQIKKIQVKDNEIYNVNSNSSDEELNNIFEGIFLLPNNIIELVNNEKSYIEKNEDSSKYLYKVNWKESEYTIEIISDLSKIQKIIVYNDEINYEINFIFDK